VRLVVAMGIVSFGLGACYGGDNCAEMGEDVFANLEKVVDLAARLGLPTKENEAAVIVGAAKAEADLGGRGVQVCLRAAEAGEAEFRILSTQPGPLGQWIKVSTFMRSGR
jgi:hypothetical protein